MSAIKSLKGCLDSILCVRDSIGAGLAPVFHVTRTWSGKQVGDGKAKDVETQVLPTPRIKDYSHDLRLLQAGTVKQNDLMLKGISKNQYPEEDMINGKSYDKRIERLYRVGEDLYEVISIVEKHVTWDVQLRILSSQERFT
jgi:hypothetical protein